MLLGFATIPACQLHAQTITISPSTGYITVSTGKTLQYSATVTGLTNTAVTWYAGGVKGGNSTVGTISGTGLYTAPTKLPAQNPVQIVVKSQANTSLSASAYVNIISAGPTITSVAPNPLAVGSITVTIQGSTFLQGAEVYISYGTNSNVQMSTISVASTSLKASGYLGSSSTATFRVKNPGSDFSNAIIVPVGSGSPPPPTYALTVVNGSGSGTYTAGTLVNIVANAAPVGKVFAGWTGAAVQSPASSSTTVNMPAAATTVTATYAVVGTYTLSVVNGTGSGSYTPGTVVSIVANTPPVGQQFVVWTGASVANPNSSATTITMPSAATTVTATYAAPVASVPYPVSTHPRLWVTPGDVTRLQGWAVSSNPVYQSGMLPLVQQAYNLYTTQFFPGGSPNATYPDPGDVQGYQGWLTEQVGAILAFNSLIDPSITNRINYAVAARNILMYAMNQAALGHSSGAPFRDPMFAVYNRANGSGEQWPLIVDWIYNSKDAGGNAILTSADKLTIRKVFMIWANDCLNASTTGGDHPSPIGTTNSLQLLPNNQPYRMASNNYYLGHARLLTMMGLAIDPTDDPAINAAQSTAVLGNSLRSYILNANGAWLYQEFAMMGDPATAASAFGISGNGAGFGLASGGLPPEGMLYGHSFGFILGQLLALQTAGFNNPAYAGPQIGLIGAPVWDRYVQGFLASLTPTAKTFASQPWLGPVYQFGSYGDLLRLWATPDFMQPFALLALLDQLNGNTSHSNEARWFTVNGVEGGSNALLTRITQPWSWSTTQSILYFMLLDPTKPTAADPRPSYPTTFYDPGAGRIVSHSDWTPTGTMFDYRASWISINHQDGDAGQFEMYRNGEWLTKEMSNYDNNAVGLTTVYHNTLALQNWCAAGTPNLQWYEAGEWANGSEWMLGLSAGDPVTVMSEGGGYVYAASDLTNLFNRPNFWTPSLAATNISQATRSILWLNSDYIVVYDRATSINSGLFKRFNLSLVTNPNILGNSAVETLASGQQLFVQTLLPISPSLSITSAYAAGNLNPIAQLEPTQYVLTVEDKSLPSDTRFLHVLQGANPGAAMAPASYLKSINGTPFDGAVFAGSAVYFPVSRTTTIAVTSFSAPAGVHTLYVTGLQQGAAYGVSIQASGGGNIVTVNPGGTGYLADAGGLLKLVF